MQTVRFEDLGLIDYKEAWDYQEKLHKEIVDAKLLRRQNHSAFRIPHSALLLCEHPHVYTLGKSGKENHLLANEKLLNEIGATFYKNNRGGDITYHGPGQLVGYPILDLDNFFTDIHRYMRSLEETIILTLEHFGISAGRVNGLTGVWIGIENPGYARKICAMGVRCSHWVTMHGFAFNVNTDLSYFNHIVPCGITDKSVTSMEKELGRKIDINEVKREYKKNFENIFDVRLTEEKDERIHKLTSLRIHA